MFVQRRGTDKIKEEECYEEKNYNPSFMSYPSSILI
jgi:hypothetical protein